MLMYFILMGNINSLGVVGQRGRVGGDMLSTGIILQSAAGNVECDDLPTTSMSLHFKAVWNEGASADTSQLYLPDDAVSTDSRTMLLPFEMFG